MRVFIPLVLAALCLNANAVDIGPDTSGTFAEYGPGYWAMFKAFWASITG